MAAAAILDFCININNSPVVCDNKILQVCIQLLQEISDMTKIGNSNKFKMAAVAILNFVHLP